MILKERGESPYILAALPRKSVLQITRKYGIKQRSFWNLRAHSLSLPFSFSLCISVTFYFCFELFLHRIYHFHAKRTFFDGKAAYSGDIRISNR